MKKITLLFITLLAATYVNAQNVSAVFANNGAVNITEINSDTEAAAIRVSGNHTMEAWVKAPDTERGYVMAMGTANSFRGAYRIESKSIATLASKKAIVAYAPAISGTDFFNVTTTSDVFDGTWHHIAVVGTTTAGITSTKIYVDGVLDATTVPNYTRPTIWTNTANNGGTMTYSTVGGRGTNTTTDVYFNGEIDEARFWTVARTQAQIQNESCVIVDATGLYRNIKLDNNILDSSVNAKTTAATGSGVSSYGTANCAPIWDGSSSSSWTVAANWRLNALPNENSDVTIATGAAQPIIDSNVSIKSLTLDASTSLTVNSGKNLTVTGAVTNSGTMTLENNASLIQGGTTNTNTGNIIVKRNSSNLKRSDYTLWSSPVAGQNLLAFSPATITTRFYNYNTTFNTGGVNGAYSAVANPAATNFAVGRGYLIRMPDDATTTPTAYPGVFTGTPNNGTIPVTLIDGAALGLRYNLVGNPYPSPIKMQNFVFDNTANIESTLYFWRKTNGEGTAYCTWVAGALVTDPGTFVSNGNLETVDPADIIQTGQGFFVEAKSGATSLSFNNSQRVTNNTGQFFKTKQGAETSKIWLNATSAAGDFSQMAITYFEGATTGLDTFDAKYFNDSPIALTSNINDREYTIDGRPAFDATDVVALNFKTDKTGDYTVAIDHTMGVFAAGQDIYLLDSKTGAETDLKAGAYTFNAAAGIDNTRFSLKYQKTLKVGAPAFNENSVSIYKNNGTLYVNSGSVAISNISVFDVQGRLISEQRNVKATTATIKDVRSNQVLIVKIVGEDNSQVTKKVVN